MPYYLIIRFLHGNSLCSSETIIRSKNEKLALKHVTGVSSFFDFLCFVFMVSKHSSNTRNKYRLPQMHFWHKFIVKKKRLIFSFILYNQNKISPNNGILLKEVLISNCLNSSLASRSPRNIILFQYCTLYILIKPLFFHSQILQLFGFYLMYLSYTLGNVLPLFYNFSRSYTSI